MSPRISERAKVLRDKLSEDAERRRILPRAVCRVCGGVVPEGTGLRIAEGWIEGRDATAERGMDAELTARGEPIVDSWRRQHAACPVERHEVIAILAGVSDLTPREGELITELDRQRVFAVLQYGWGSARLVAHQPLPNRAFEWVDVPRLKAAVEQVLATTRPRRCVEGACGVCGVGVSVGWVESPLTWPDGSRAPLCGECARASETYAKPELLNDLEHLRLVGLWRWLGLWTMGAEPLGFRVFAEVATDEERQEGYGEAFSFRPIQLAEVRHRQYRRRPHLAPPDVRARIDAELAEERRARAEEAARAAEANVSVWDRIDWTR